MPEPIRVAMQNHRRTLGGVPVLVHVGTDLGDTLDAEVPWGNVVAERFQERQHETPDTPVHMTSDAALTRDRGKFGHRIHDAVGIVERRRDDHRSVRSHQLTRRRDIGTEVLVEREPNQVHAEVVRRLGVRRVRGDRGEDLGALDTTCGRSFTIHEHRHEDGLGAT